MTSDGKRKIDKFKWHRALRKVRGISATHKAVGWVMLDYVNVKTGQAWPSQQTIADDLSVSTKTVGRAQDALVAAGFFYVAVKGSDTGKRAGSNVYQFTMPKPPTPMSGVNEVTPDTHVHGCEDVTPDTSVPNPGHPRPVTPDTHVPLTGNEKIKEQITSRNHLGAGQSPSEPRDQSADQRDTSASAPHVPGEVLSFKDEKQKTTHAAGIPCEEPGCTTGYEFPNFQSAIEFDFLCPQCRTVNAA